MKKKRILSLLALLWAAVSGANAQIAVSGEGNTFTFTMPAYSVEITTELWYKLDATKTFDQNVADYGTQTDFFLDRTLTKDVWNTFASPFAIASGDIATYFGAGAKVRQLNTTSVEGTVLTVTFTDASSIEAGKPYLVKPAVNVDFSADGKEFAGVNLNTATPTATTTTYVDFIPTLGATTIPAGDVKNVLFMAGEKTLKHPSSLPANMKGFCAYFQLKGDAANAASFNLDFGNGETTGISSLTPDPSPKGEESIYSLDGRRLSGKPAQKGVYIVNGKKMVIK